MIGTTSTKHQHKKLKRRHKRCSQAFGKTKSATIKRVEHKECGCVIQVTSQVLIERAIIKENSQRFTLAHSSQLLHPNIANSLGHSGEGQLSQNMLKDNANVLCLLTKD